MIRRRVIAWTIEQIGVSRLLLECGHKGQIVRDAPTLSQSVVKAKHGLPPYVYKRTARCQKVVCEECEAIDRRESADDGITGE